MKKRIAFLTSVSIVFFVVTNGALACKGTQVLFEDNFTTLDQGWGIPDNNKSVKDGKLILQPNINSTTNIINQANIFEDVDACVNVTLAKSDDPSQIGGIVFWAKDSGDYYNLQVSGDGHFQVSRWTSGRWLHPVSWQENAAIKKGIGQTNQLRVVTKDNQATVYINDVQVGTLKGQPPQGGSLIGLSSQSPEKFQAVWEFSNLKITKP